MSRPSCRFAVMSDKQYWDKRLEEFLRHRESEGIKPGGINDDRAIVGQWIRYALMQSKDPAGRNEALLDQWVTDVKDLTSNSQAGYRSHVKQWWKWIEIRPANDGEPSSVGRIDSWMARLDTYLSDLEHRGRRPGTIGSKRGKLRKWIEFTCATGRNPAAWDPPAVEAGFVEWGMTESAKQRDSIRRHIRAWCNYWHDNGLASLTLDDLVQQFRDEGYPDHHAAQHLAARTEYEVVLRSLPDLPYERRDELRNAWKRASNGYDYGGVGVTAGLDGAVRDVSEADWPQMRDGIIGLCFGDGEQRQDHEQSNSSVSGKGYRRGSCGASDGLESKWGPRVCYCGAELSYKVITADGHKLRAEKHCRRSGVFIWEGKYVDRSTDTIQQVWVPRGGISGRFGGGIAERIETAVGSVAGFGYVIATRLLAICNPVDVVPIYLLRKEGNDGQVFGKLDMIELLDELSLLDTDGTHEFQQIVQQHKENGDSGVVVMRSNDLLLNTLRPHFADDDTVDTWGIARFLHWFSERQAGHGASVAGTVADEDTEAWIGDDDFAALADELLCDVDLLEDVVELLEDKGQVILYGPPGTGKTYFAQRLAVMLSLYEDSDDDGAYSLVQFHPAYSYEDFFEGFRPRVDDTGQMAYELAPGPLVRLAERAAEHPDELHVMVIDEINRANLPRVLGELLFLLEYRGETVNTQYRPDSKFSLPPNLWFIGTMNTADRSIALIDAAMRRRFHFVPFFPNRPPTAGLLGRWTQRNAPEQAWVAELLDGVNRELEQALGGDQLLIGPSHFMKRGLDEDSLRRIWEYNIEPLIEDQLFGQQEVIGSFRFDAVRKRHRRGVTAADGEPEVPDEPAGDVGHLSDEDDDIGSQDGA